MLLCESKYIFFVNSISDLYLSIVPFPKFNYIFRNNREYNANSDDLSIISFNSDLSRLSFVVTKLLNIFI